jgi:hypothetical protein
VCSLGKVGQARHGVRRRFAQEPGRSAPDPVSGHPTVLLVLLVARPRPVLGCVPNQQGFGSAQIPPPPNSPLRVTRCRTDAQKYV